MSLEDERRARIGGVQTGDGAGSDFVSGLIDECMVALGSAEDSKGMAVAMRRVVAMKVIEMVRDGKVSGGDMIRLMGMVNDRADGKVIDSVEVSGVIGFGDILRDVMGRGGGLPDRRRDEALLADIDVIDAEVIDS